MHTMALNRNPPHGYKRFSDDNNARCQNWWTKKVENANHTDKVRYPRVGAFEVAVRCPRDFAEPRTGLREHLEVWSKLRTNRWPNPEKLAEIVARMLISSQRGEDVNTIV